MRKKFKKIVAAITLCAFSLGSITPAYANTEKVTRLDFEQISIEYDANGDLSRELFKIENTYYYRVIEEGKNIAVSLNEDGSGDITINNSQDNSFIYYSKLNGEPTTNTRSQVLLADKKVGTPLVKGAKVVATVEKQGRSPKIIVFKMKPKKNYRKKQGHRQAYTKVLIKEIVLA